MPATTSPKHQAMFARLQYSKHLRSLAQDGLAGASIVKTCRSITLLLEKERQKDVLLQPKRDLTQTLPVNIDITYRSFTFQCPQGAEEVAKGSEAAC